MDERLLSAVAEELVQTQVNTVAKRLLHARTDKREV
jgi:hypothetical protein